VQYCSLLIFPRTVCFEKVGIDIYHWKQFSINIRADRSKFFFVCFFFPPLWLYSPVQALAASMKLSVSLKLLDLGQSVGLLGRVMSSSQGLCLYTSTENSTTQALNIHALCGILTHGPGVRASEDGSCLRPLGYRDRPKNVYLFQFYLLLLYGY
jgi:hypothetical protein